MHGGHPELLTEKATLTWGRIAGNAGTRRMPVQMQSQGEGAAEKVMWGGMAIISDAVSSVEGVHDGPLRWHSDSISNGTGARWFAPV